MTEDKESTETSTPVVTKTGRDGRIEGKVAGGHDGGVAEGGCREGDGHDGEADWVGQVGSPGNCPYGDNQA